MEFLFGQCCSSKPENMDESFIKQYKIFNQENEISTEKASIKSSFNMYKRLQNPQFNYDEIFSQQSLINNLSSSRTQTQRILQRQKLNIKQQIICEDSTFYETQNFFIKSTQSKIIFKQSHNYCNNFIRNKQNLSGTSFKAASQLLTKGR